MTWSFVVHPELPEFEVPSDALRAAPPEVARASERLLPRAAGDGRCRICGAHGPLTREHIPPRSAGNSGRSREHTFDQWFTASRDELPQEIPGGRVLQAGVWGATLCMACNNFVGGHYIPEYKGWAARASKVLHELPPRSELDGRTSFTRAMVEFSDVDPGAFVRAALAAMCSVSVTWDIAGRHPELRRIILEGAAEPLPAGLRLYLSLYWGPLTRICGPSLHVDRQSGAWEWIMEVAHPGLALLMVLTGTGQEPGLLDIGEWSTWPPGKRANYEGELDVGFGHVPYPGDPRTRAQIEAGGSA